MKATLLSALCAGALALACHPASAANQCLSNAEALVVARMASVMGIGAALRKCGDCLGSRYAEVLDHYESSHLLQDFRTAGAAIQDKEKSEYADSIMRQAARNVANDLSATCEACERAADTIDGLSTPEARSKLYEGQVGKLSQLREMKSCP